MIKRNFSLFVAAGLSLLAFAISACQTNQDPGTLDPQLEILQELIEFNPVELAVLLPEVAKYDSYSLEEQRSIWTRAKSVTENPYYLELIDQEISKIDIKIAIRDAPPPPTPTPEPTPYPGENPGGSDVFLWKPVSESTGKLVILYPNKYFGNTKSAAVYTASGQVETQSNLHTETHNGNRPHYRFSKPGSAYGENVKTVLTLKDGSTITWDIGDGGNRTEI